MSAFRTEVIGDAVLYLGDCRAQVKDAAACKACDWVWRPSGKTTRERCPNCGKQKDVRRRKWAPKTGLLKAWLAERPGYSTRAERTYRRRAVVRVGRGNLACVRCGCDRVELLEINHKNGGGGKELKGKGHKMYREIARLVRPIDDLELLCKPCNAVHALELKFGSLPFRVVWGQFGG